MHALPSLGETLTALRQLRGESQLTAATNARVSVAALEEAERGRMTSDTRALLADYYGVDPVELLSGSISPTGSESEGATVFLLHATNQDFNAQDLGTLMRAMGQARRALAAMHPPPPSLARRLSFAPAPVAGPFPRDAARQGYRLAREVRTKVGLGGEPIPDVRALAEKELAALVFSADFETTNLRATAVLDSDRGAAAIVLSKAESMHAKNPLVARVHVAHELCHLLFDPTRPGAVQIAMDGGTEAGEASASQLESRAKGFAAELLLPWKGLTVLLGSASGDATTSAAAAMVEQASAHFRAPWEITSRHLANLGWFDRELVGELLSPRVRRHHTPAALPGSERAPDPPPRPAATQGDADAAAAEANSARRSAAAGMRLVVEEAAITAYAHASAGVEQAATDTLVRRLDLWLLGAQWQHAAALLEMLDVAQLPAESLTAVLSVTKPATERFLAQRERFFARTMDRLQSEGLEPGLLASVERRLR